MPDVFDAGNFRRGTRSCTECRRRKLRCSWGPDNHDTCRRCDERGMQCAPQVLAARPMSRSGATTTRHRVAQLEEHVAQLVQVVRNMETRIGHDPSGPPHGVASVVEDSSDDLRISDSSIPARPSYLNSLFNNDLISSTDTPTESAFSQTSPGHAADPARNLLVPLIPSREDVATIATHSSGWLLFINKIFPIGSMGRSGNEMLAQYELVQQPDVDPATLASWLISLALTLEHIPKAQRNTGISSRWLEDAPAYSRMVAEAVENAIVRPDQMACSVGGVETLLLLIRLDLMCGSFTKSFLHLRRALAAAELIGLPRAVNGTKAALWKSVCLIERFHSMMFAFPSATRCYPRPVSGSVFVGGRVVPIDFASQLSNVTLNLGDLGDPTATTASSNDLYASISKLDNELSQLASLAPPGWWSRTGDLPLPDLLIQYIYHYVTMRTHLPAILRPSLITQSQRSRSACVRACRDIARCYLILYPMLPKGPFMCRITSLQVFTAMVILLLSDHHEFLSENANPAPPQNGGQSIVELVVQIVNTMEADVEEFGLKFVGETVATIKALINLLGNENSDLQKDEILLTVPLLGKLSVRRRQGSIRASESRQEVPNDNLEGGPQVVTEESFGHLSYFGSETEAWDLFWSVEEAHEPWLYESFMPDGYNAQE